MNLTHQPQATTFTPAINFASSAPLSDLLAAFDAAERLLEIACSEEEKFPSSRETVKVFGGTIPASTLVIEGRPDAHTPAFDWFYHSREQIDRDYEKQVFAATRQDELDAIEKRFAGYRAECVQQQKAVDKTIPRGKRAAERRLKAAHRAVSAAERRIIEYKPADLDEAVKLLEYVSGGKRRSCFSTAEDDLHAIMLNVAVTIRRAA